MISSALERTQTLPNIYQNGYQEGHRDIVAYANERYTQNTNVWQETYTQQLIDRRMYLGDHRNLNSYMGADYNNNKFVFNPSMPVINMVCGRQRQHRKSSRIVPVHGSSDKTASQATTVIQSAYSFDDTYNKFSACFKEGSGIAGISLLHSWIDYRSDPICGDLRTECYSADMICMDAFWRELDLSDCKDIRTRKYLHKNMIKQLLPDREHDIDMINGQAYYDNKFTFMPNQYNIRRKDYMAYDEFWFQAERMGTFLVDPETYESVEINASKDEMDEIKYRFPHIVIVKEKVPTVHLAIIVNNVCLYKGANPLKVDMYPFTPCVGYHDLSNPNYAFRYQGIMRNIRDETYLYSYRKQLELDLLAAQFSGVNVEEDALIDDTDAFKVGPAKVRFFKKGRMAAIQDIPGANINPANFQATQFLKEGVQSDAGVTPELLGQSEDNDVGITEKLRQDAGLTTLQEIFDNFDLFQRNATRLHWAMIQKNYTYGKVKRMLKEAPTNEFRDKSFQKYDAVVENAPMTTTTKQLAFKEKYFLWKEGLPIPVDLLLDDLTIQDKDKMIQAIKQQQEMQQQQQQQMTQLQMQNQTIVNESLQSKAMSDRSLAQEREAKGRLEQVQIMTEFNKSEHERQAGILNEAKAAKEIESMGVEDFVKILTLLDTIQAKQNESLNKEVENGTQLQ